MAQFSRNLVLLGDAAVGKTSLIRRFVVDKYDDKYITTIGKKVSKKDVTVRPEGKEGADVTLMIWDIIGQKGYRQIQSLSFMHAHAALLVADVTRADTLESLKSYWIPLILKVTGPVPTIILGNKSDLKTEAQFSVKDLEKLAGSCEGFGAKLPSYLTSAKTGVNVEEAFGDIADRILEQKTTPRVLIPPQLMDTDEISSVQDIVDHIVTDFADQFGGIENATPFVKHQLEVTGLDLARPTETAVLNFVERLAKVESTFREKHVVEKNRQARLRLFQYKGKS